MSWTVIVLIVCFLVAVFAIWKEYARPKKKHLALRIIASLLAIISLVCIALPINYSKDITIQDDHSAVLLTQGFETDSLVNYKTSPLFTADKSIAKAYPKAKLIRLDELKNDSPAISKLHAFGYGLNTDELKELDSLPVTFHSAKQPGGIVSINWNQKLKTGETLTVQGKYKNESSKAVKLVLKGLSTQLDTVTIASKTNKDFELTTVPKSEGQVVYHFQAIAGADTLENESLPVEIDPIKPMKILLLSASPDFETRFLKNWLSENGFSVAVRSAISKDKFSSEYVNIEPLKIDHLNGALLDKFDLVIGDLSVLKAESTVPKEQVTQKGLGIVIRADSSSKISSWLQSDFPVERANVKNLPPVSLVIKGKEGKSAAIKTDPVYIRIEPGTQSLVNDTQNHTLVNSSLAGTGRLVFSTINNTYTWMLQGNQDDYTAFWSLLISKAARKVAATQEWTVTPQFPVPDELVSLRLEASNPPGQIAVGNSTIAPNQNPFIPFEWNNRYWPAPTGWNSVKQTNGQAAWWYVYDTHEWRGVKAAQKIAATRNYAETYGANASVTKPIHEKLQIEIPKIYFYLLLLAACTFLWIEGKLIN